MKNALIVTGLVGLLTASLVAQEDDAKSNKKLTSATYGSFRLRSIGPALMSGRISDIAIDPVQPNTWYVAAGSGNLWKTVNAGTTWTPIFENYSSYSIGCVTIDPQDHHTIWVGTGEAVGGRHVGYGDGVYLSRDGGKSFRNAGLKASEHIGKILVDPGNGDVVYVAAQGPLWSPGGERGLYKTTDGGKTWKLILSKGPYTGVTDVVCDPRNPDVLYAATHQRHRTVWALVNGGPESGIHKSTDGGATWTELRTGLPGGDKGKISLAVSPQQPDVVYATIELPGRTGGFWRSSDRGASWSKMSDFISGGTGSHYYQEIFCDPHRFDVIYQVDVQLARSEDGGRNWERVSSPWKHVDNHAVAFHPSDPDFVLVGCDGGLYRSYDRCKTYFYSANLPLTQFYKLDVDYDEPFYHIVGGTQDNNTQYGPSRTRSESGIRNSDWRTTIGGDGHDCAIDPQDPNIIYCESQEGFLRRYDRRTGEAVDIRPRPGKGEDEFRFNWDSPILISPHSHTRLYFGSNRLHRSDDRGDSWTTISPDLSRGRDRFRLQVMERVWSIDATYDLYAMSQYGNITSISESPLVEGLIYVGTDDGLVQVTEDGGQTWRKIERFFDVPEESFVNDIKADLHDPDTVYVLLDNHKTGDFRPYLLRSTDRGRTWTSMVGDLPDRHLVWRLVQDHVKADLFFLGTEFGLFFTRDGGQRWIKLTAGVPTIPFRDLEIQRRENDLVGASFGRGFFVLDDYSALRTIDEALLEQPFALFPVRRAWRYFPERTLGGTKGSQGDAFYTAPNPTFGAVFTYYLRDALKSRKQQRSEREAKIKSTGGDNPPPGWDELKMEEREEPPRVILTVRDAAGNVAARVRGSTSAGIHRIAWDLRYELGGRGFGPLAPPGKYTVQLAQRVDDQEQVLGEPVEFEVATLGEPSLPPQDPQAVLAFQLDKARLSNRVAAASGRVGEVLEQVEAMKRAVSDSRTADEALRTALRELELALLDVRDKLRGDETRSSRSQLAPPSITSRLRGAIFATFRSTLGPTTTQRQQIEIATEEFAELEPTLRRLLEVDLPRIRKQLDEAGVAWTPGRAIPR